MSNERRQQPHQPMRIKLEGERREGVIESVQRFFDDQIDFTLSQFQAERVVDFFVRELGAPVYNQAIRDAHRFMQEKLVDLEDEFYEPEEPYSR